MKIERISSNKVKLTVFNDELLRWGIATHNIVANSPEIQDICIDLIKRAEHETGVKMLDNPGILIEVMQRADGIVFFVTTAEEGQPVVAPPLRKKLLRTKSVLQRVPLGIYMFAALDDLCAYVKLLGTCDVVSDLYFYNDAYFLVLPEENERLAGLTDYATPVKKTGLSVAFLQEHGKTVARANALETVGKYFL